tara:strand:- start:1241 stop:1603 length:363 start_codon:yes stop_codon:yes gene_type:complete
MESYQLIIELNCTIKISVGKLGVYEFFKGFYVYTGSAKKNMESRIERHLQRSKKLHWHIDYLLTDINTNIIAVRRSLDSECKLNEKGKGKVLVPGFGSSDCVNKCVSHLKFTESYNHLSF